VLGVRAVPSALAVNVRVPKSEQLRRSFKCCARTPVAWCTCLPRPRATMYCNLSALSSLNALASAAPRFGAGHSPDLAVARSGVRSRLQVRGEIMHSQCPDPASMCWHRPLSDLPGASRHYDAVGRWPASGHFAGGSVVPDAGLGRCRWSSALCRSVTVYLSLAAAQFSGGRRA